MGDVLVPHDLADDLVADERSDDELGDFQPLDVALDNWIARMRADLLQKNGIDFKGPQLPPYPRAESQYVKSRWFNTCLGILREALLEGARAAGERMKAYEVAMALPPSTMGEA